MNRLAGVALLIGSSCSPTIAVVPPIAHASGCLPAREPADLVVQVTRYQLPHGRGPTVARGAVTHAGTCPADAACKQVDAATMSAIWAELVGAAAIDHGPPSPSPHYGGRWIAATWTGSSCDISDSGETPVAPASAPRFDAAFDAVVHAFK